jgi:hypothetical protein
MDTKNLADLYKCPPIEWSRIEDRLNQGLTTAPGGTGPDRYSTWLATINADGTPHVTGIGALFVDGAFWFETGPTTRKGRNLARDPRCSLSFAADEFDLTVDGVASLVTDPGIVAAMADRWAEGGWPCRVDESGTALTAAFSAPSAGPPPWSVYRVESSSASAVLTVEPGGATAWQF